MEQENLSISNFKTFLLKLLLPLLAILILILSFFNFFFENEIILSNSVSGASKINRIINETHYNEIPIFGSSAAEGGYIPEIIGNNYYNYGITGTRVDVMLMMLKEECKKTKKSPLIIANFDLDGIDHSLANLANYIYNSNYGPIKKLLGDRYQIKYSVPAFKYYGFYENYLQAYLNSKMQSSKYVNKGAYIDKNIIEKKIFDELVEKRKETKTKFFSEKKLTDELFSLIQSNNNRLFIFVVPPYHKSYFEKYQNLNVANKFLNDLDKLKNVKVLDFSKLQLSDSSFHNTSHLNYHGALIFSQMLKDSLALLNIPLPNK